jgi:hypothetical protein
MELRLHERRTETRLIADSGEIGYEHDCPCCDARFSVDPAEVLRADTNSLQDSRGNPMMEQKVSCRRCGERWADVFERIYPTPVRDEGDR